MKIVNYLDKMMAYTNLIKKKLSLLLSSKGVFLEAVKSSEKNLTSCKYKEKSNLCRAKCKKKRKQRKKQKKAKEMIWFIPL